MGVTRAGWASLVVALVGLALGLIFGWRAFDLIGLGLLAVLGTGLALVARPSGLSIDRQIQPPRVPKGSPAIAFLNFANTGRTTVPTTAAEQPFGDNPVRTVIPRLRPGERGSRTYRLPTTRRGIFDVGPVEVSRHDPFDLFDITRRFGAVERIWVYPRVVELRPLPVGRSHNLDGPSSDLAPQGTITFHRLRDYVTGDDLRLVHWRSSARTGRLVVRHNVDTSQPYSVVLLDQRPDRYTEQSFEDAVDVAASALVAASGARSPVELRLTDGTAIGGARLREVTPLIDHLTGVAAEPDGSLQSALLALRRLRGGTSLVVVTGVLDPGDLPYVAALRRRFEQLVVVSLDTETRTGTAPHFTGLRIIVATDVDSAAAAWNAQVHA